MVRHDEVSSYVLRSVAMLDHACEIKRLMRLDPCCLYRQYELRYIVCDADSSSRGLDFELQHQRGSACCLMGSITQKWFLCLSWTVRCIMRPLWTSMIVTNSSVSRMCWSLHLCEIDWDALGPQDWFSYDCKNNKLYCVDGSAPMTRKLAILTEEKMEGTEVHCLIYREEFATRGVLWEFAKAAWLQNLKQNDRLLWSFIAWGLRRVADTVS